MIPAMMMYFAPEFKCIGLLPTTAKRMQSSMRKFQLYIKSNFELVFWAVALLTLYFMNVDGQSLCMFQFAGVDWCPGCGLGHAIHDAMHLNLATSFNEHPFGIPALLIIAHRIIQLISKPKLHYEQQ